MKKIFTICMLALAVMIGGISADAKTSHRKKSTKKTTQTTKNSYTPTEFGADLFIECDNDPDPNSLASFRNNIGASLIKLGFTKSGSSRDEQTYSNGQTRVEMNMYDRNYPAQVSIYFSNNGERDAFINQTKALGFVWDGLECTNGWEKTLALSAEDKSVTMTFIP